MENCSHASSSRRRFATICFFLSSPLSYDGKTIASLRRENMPLISPILYDLIPYTCAEYRQPWLEITSAEVCFFQHFLPRRKRAVCPDGNSLTHFIKLRSLGQFQSLPDRRIPPRSTMQCSK
jgi:hypothetical protein